jgi:hypothetical protein
MLATEVAGNAGLHPRRRRYPQTGFRDCVMYSAGKAGGAVADA